VLSTFGVLALCQAHTLEHGFYIGPLCGNVTGYRVYHASAVAVEQEALVAYQTAFESALQTQCSLATGAGQPQLVGCTDCLNAYRRYVCSRHTPCAVWSRGATASRATCAASVLACPSLCTEVQRLCPFSLLGQVRCPALGGVEAGLPQQGVPSAGLGETWPGARWNHAQDCFAGWSQ
jgi:hypothetical protein